MHSMFNDKQNKIESTTVLVVRPYAKVMYIMHDHFAYCQRVSGGILVIKQTTIYKTTTNHNLIISEQ